MYHRLRIEEDDIPTQLNLIANALAEFPHKPLRFLVPVVADETLLKQFFAVWENARETSSDERNIVYYQMLQVAQLLVPADAQTINSAGQSILHACTLASSDDLLQGTPLIQRALDLGADSSTPHTEHALVTQAQGESWHDQLSVGFLTGCLQIFKTTPATRSFT